MWKWSIPRMLCLLVALTGCRAGAPTTMPVAGGTPLALPRGSALSVAPGSGPAGTVFAITATGLPPGSRLHILGRGPDHSFVLSEPIAADARGTVTVRYDSTGGPVGTYSVTVAADLEAAMETDGRPLARGAFAVTGGGVVPILALEPERAPCDGPDPHVLARGRNFPPGASIGLYLFRPDGAQASLDHTTRGIVDADGAFAWPVRLAGCGSATPDGAQFVVNAVRRQGNIDPRRGLATATFTVARSSRPLPALPTRPIEPR
jgi:hypothetical protein